MRKKKNECGYVFGHENHGEMSGYVEFEQKIYGYGYGYGYQLHGYGYGYGYGEKKMNGYGDGYGYQLDR